MSVQTATSGEEALVYLEHQTFRLLITDYHMPGMDGLTLAQTAAELAPDMAIIMCTGSTNPDDFSITSDTCSGRTLNLYESCTIQVVFIPQIVGLRDAALNVVNSGGQTVFNYPLTGNGVITSVSLSSSDTTGGTVSLTGNQLWGATVVATATPNSGYSFNSWSENGSIVSSAAQYSFTVNGSRNLVAVFSATPLAITVAPLSGYLGEVPTGKTSPDRTFVVTNTGTIPLTISSLYFYGVNRAEFAVSSNGCSGLTLSPSTSCTVRLNFTPTGAGTRTASLAIPYDSVAPPYVIALSGFAGTPIMRAAAGSYTANYYTSVQSAYNAAANGDEIKLWTADFAESLNCNRPVNVTIRGGYNGNFADQVGKSVLTGTLTISSGTLVVDGLSLGGTYNQSTISVVKDGPGTGLVTSSAGEIYCGNTCSAATLSSATVTLNAAPDTCSTFTGWSGSNCSGTGSCTVDMGMDASITASFGKVPPTVSFTSKPTPQVAPNTVQFTSMSQCADSWVWSGRQRYHTFKIACHPGDEGEPVLTIMLPEED